MSLSGKVTLVTGGTGALGSVVAQRFVREGAPVCISFRNEQELAGLPASFRKSIKPIKADVTDERQVEQLFDAVIFDHQRLDVLVHTVGGYIPAKPLQEVTAGEWDSMMNINLRTAFLCTREALRRMKGQPYGRIINISAMVGVSPTPGRAAYAVSKASVSLLTEIVAREQKGTGITVNAIAPSILATEANKTSMPDEDQTKWVSPESIADMICYLCSQAAGSVTGTTIRASGGL